MDKSNISTYKNWQLVNFCEFDKYASDAYCAIHGVSPDLNLGDITQVDEKKIDDFNMMVWGFPCQSISAAGKQEGFIDENGNQTRSGLYYEGIRILREKKPFISVIENVKNLTSKKFSKEFNQILSDLNEAGYNSYYKVLNSKDFGVPQNRERIFIVSIRKDVDNGKFQFPQGFDSGIRLKDVLEDEVDDKFYIDTPRARDLIKELVDDGKLDDRDIEKDISNTVRVGGATQYRQLAQMECNSNSLGYLDKGTGKYQSNSVYSQNGIARCLSACDYKSPMAFIEE